jgi:F-type H+-transporting ATPase subunit b
LQEQKEDVWDGRVEAAKVQINDTIKKFDLAIWQEEGQKHLFEAKRENVDLQLEAEYRERLVEAHQAVKKRLDYNLAKETAMKNFQHNHMTRWIIDNVVKGITHEQVR